MPSRTERTRLTREESRAQTRARLLDAAEALFAEKGFHAASLDEIAERAGFTRGAVYWNYANKDELFHAVIERRSQERLDKIVQLRAEQASPTEFIAALRQLDEGDEESTRRWHLLALEQLAYALRHPSQRQQVAARERRVHREIGEQAAATYQQLGLVPPLTPDEMGVVIHALDWGLRTQRQLNPRAAPTRLLTQVLQLLIQAPPPTSSAPRRGQLGGSGRTMSD